LVVVINGLQWPNLSSTVFKLNFYYQFKEKQHWNRHLQR